MRFCSKEVCKLLTCFDVASYFIKLANDTGSFISNLKLQKLVYYAQAWFLAIYGEPLFDEEFQAWIHGPVIPDLYARYKEFGWRPIQEDANPDLPDHISAFLDEVASEYFACDAYELEKMTHLEDPWRIARGNLPPDASSSEIIQKGWMQEYYRNRAAEEKNQEN